MRSGMAPTRSGTRPARSGTRPVQSGMRPIRSGMQPVRSGMQPVRSGAALMRSGDRPKGCGRYAEPPIVEGDCARCAFLRPHRSGKRRQEVCLRLFAAEVARTCPSPTLPTGEGPVGRHARAVVYRFFIRRTFTVGAPLPLTIEKSTCAGFAAQLFSATVSTFAWNVVSLTCLGSEKQTLRSAVE